MLIKQTAKMTESERIAAENSNNQYLQALSYVAVGTIFPFAGKEAPTTFMFCDGRELDKTEYSELFEAIGYTFGGSGDVFKLPDLRGKTLFGYDSNADHFKTLGKTGGTKEIAIQDSNLPEHNFFGSDSDSGIERGKVAYSSDGRYTFLGKESATNAAESNLLYIQGKGKKIETLPPYLVSNFIIKVMQGTAACEYDYAKAISTAVKQNFDEAVAAGTIKGEKGDSGVYVGTEEPTDPDVMVWVNPDGIADDIPSGGSGTDGVDGKDGFSPTVEVTENKSGHTVSITDVNGTKSFDVLNGKDGERGPQGEQGEQGEKGETGEKGDAGVQGLQGENGYTPIRGVDYWTKADKEDIRSNAESFIVDELAKRGQVKPEFANDISECTDTTKLYVLPDGNIYAYMKKIGALFTNQLTNAIDTDGTLYNNGLGYKLGYGLNSNGAEGTYADVVTGYIPIQSMSGLILRVSGYMNSVLGSFDQMKFYDSTFTNIAVDNVDRPDLLLEKGSTFEIEEAYDNEVYTFTYDYDAHLSESGYYGGILANAKYVRLAFASVDVDKLAITINEEIVFGTSYEWANTGHAFVPTDYEDRIIELEKNVENHKNKIKTLEMYGANSVSDEDIPAYIKTEADDVMDRLIEKQGNRSFALIGMSDFHYQNYGEKYNTVEDSRDNLIRASKAISYIMSKVHIDAVATLGDNGAFGEGTDTQLAYAHKWHKQMNEILKITQQPGVIDFRTPGNHDRMGANDTAIMPDSSIYRYISGYNRQCDYVDVCGGWCYKDFVGHKLRVIMLNTSECEGKSRFNIHSGYHISNKQYNWLIETLDLSDKDDASEWQILLLSHHRADDWQIQTDDSEYGENAYILPNVLNAYKNGGSYSGIVSDDNISVSCDFAGKNQARLIGQIHGHHHNYKFQNIYLGAITNSNQTDIMAVGTPTTSFITSGNADNDGDTYTSVKDTATETAFCIYNIDLDNHKIYAIHYGNGIDREIDY